MAFLGSDFIISSLIWLCVISIFVFAFRKHIAKLFYKQSSLDIFLKNLKKFLNERYPSVIFDFEIIELSKSEQNPNSRKYLILDNIIDQYIKLPLDNSRYPTSTPQNLQWGSYTFNCEPNRDKLPSDWGQRKNALIIRENKKCFRCNKHIDINSSDIHMIRALSNGGKYHLENLLPVCKDCARILSKDSKKMHHLDIKDDLYELVKNN
jgi:hypothetical protein